MGERFLHFQLNRNRTFVSVYRRGAAALGFLFFFYCQITDCQIHDT
jgi:hypothetical protein